jgi:hypothetical protein
VRIVRGFAGVYSINPNKAVTVGNTIYFNTIDTETRPDKLVHECTHVWQYQHWGTRYTTDALAAQLFLDQAYSWEAELAAGKTRWQDFNPEAEARFLQNVYCGKVCDGFSVGQFYDEDPVAASAAFDFQGTNHTPLAREAVAYVRGARVWHFFD